MLFNPKGQLALTPGAVDAFERNKEGPFKYLQRHWNKDWGEVSAEDAAENDLSLKEGFRVLSAYTLPDKTKIWIITEEDRSVTTILLPDEY